METLPGWVWIVITSGIIVLFASIVATVYAGNRSLRVAMITGAVFGAWLLASTALAEAGVYIGRADQLVPSLGIALLAVVVGGLLATRIPAISASLNGPHVLERLTAIQTFRVLGGVFVIVMALGHLPAAFAIPAGLGDVAVGVAAPFVARAIARGTATRAGIYAFHLLGMLDLVVAVTIGTMAAPGPVQLLDVSPTTEQMTVLPLVLVPTVAVPIAFVLHIAALRRLRRRTETVAEPLQSRMLTG